LRSQGLSPEQIYCSGGVTYIVLYAIGGVAESNYDTDTFATDFTAAARGPSVCVSVTLVHPAEAVGRNEMPFDRYTRVFPINTVLGASVPMGRGDLV